MKIFNLFFIQLHSLHTMECTDFLVSPPNSVPIHLVVLYRPPQPSVLKCGEYLADYMEKNINSTGKVVLTGDFKCTFQWQIKLRVHHIPWFTWFVWSCKFMFHSKNTDCRTHWTYSSSRLIEISLPTLHPVDSSQIIIMFSTMLPLHNTWYLLIYLLPERSRQLICQPSLRIFNVIFKMWTSQI